MSVYIYFFLFFLYLSLFADGAYQYYYEKSWQLSCFSGIAGTIFVFSVLWKVEFLYFCTLGGFLLFFTELSLLKSVNIEIWSLWKYFLILVNSILLILISVNTIRFGKSDENSLYFKFNGLSSYKAVLYFASILLLFGWIGGIILFIP